MSDHSSSSGFAFIAGLAVGVAVGAIAGLLFAPESGEETRKKLTEKGKELSNDLYDKYEELKGSVGEILEDIKNIKSEEA